MKYAYYPGCTLETTAKEYNESVIDVCARLGIDLTDIPGWSCCGASSGHSTDYRLAHTLSGRNLALAEREGLDIAVACPACYLRLNATQKECQNNTGLRDQISDLIKLPYSAKLEVRHILDIICNSVGLEKVEQSVIKPLSGLKVVAYYGCYLVRPRDLTCFDDPENPQSMDKLLKSAGATVLDWRGKVECCGGSLSFSGTETVKHLVSEIIEAACEVEAQAIVTACPLCQANLETRQSGKSNLPIFYFSELLALAFGLTKADWFKRHLISPVELLKKQRLW